MSKNMKIKDFNIYIMPDSIYSDGSVKQAETLVIKRNGEDIASMYFYSDELLNENKNNIFKSLNTYNPNDFLATLKNINEEQYIIGDGLKKEINKNRYQNSSNNANGSNSSYVNRNFGNKKYTGSYEQLPIFALIESMVSMGYLKIVGELENNGSETKYKIVINTPTSIIEDNLLVSAVSRDQYHESPEKANFYTEFKNYFRSSKGSGGEYNFMIDLERLGAFGEPLKFSNYNSKEEYNTALKEKIRPIIRSVRSEFFKDNGKNFIIESSSYSGISNKVSMPQTMYTPKLFSEKNREMKKLWDILKLRGFSDEIITDSIDSGVIKFGTAINPKSGFTSYGMYANMHDPLEPKYPKGYESFFSKEEGKFIKLFASIKRTIRNKDSITGSSYIVSCDYSKNKNIKGTIFSEAVLDSIAMKDIMRYCGRDYKDFNHLSVQGVGNMVNFFRENFGFFYQQTDMPAEGLKEGDLWIVDSEVEKVELSEDLQEQLKNKLNDLKIKFIFDKSKKGSSKQLFKLRKFFEHLGIKNNIDVFEVKYSGMKVDLDKSRDDNYYIMNNTNVDSFFEENNILIDYSKESKKYIYYIERENKKDRLFDKEKDSLVELRQRVLNVLKSDVIYLAFDNDVAGLKHYKPLTKMLKDIGIECRYTIPPLHTFENKEESKTINDNNDVLLFIRYLEGLNKFSKDKIVGWVEDRFLSGMNTKLGFDSVDKAISLSIKAEKIMKNDKISEQQKNELIKELNNKPKPPQIIGSGRVIN